MGGGTTLNNSICYGMEESTSTIENDNRSKIMTVPGLCAGDSHIFDAEKYPNYIKPKYNINHLLHYCDDNKAFILKDLIMDFATVCNKIAYSLLYGAQMEYKKSSYKRRQDL